RDVSVRSVQDVEPGVQRHRLTATCWPRDENHPIRLHQVVQIQLLLELFVAERIDPELGTRRVQQPADDFFAEERRTRVDAEIEMFLSAVFKMLSPVYNDTVLPLPVGPVTRIIPYGFIR